MSNGTGDRHEMPDFGGKPLEQVPGLPSGAISKLQALGFNDAEQVVAALAVPTITDEMKSALAMSDQAFDDVVQKLRNEVPMMAAMTDTEHQPLGALPPTPEIEALVLERAE